MFYPEDNRDPIGQICFHFQRYLTSHWGIALYQFWLNVQLVVTCRGMLVPRNSIVERCVDYNIMIPGFDCDSDTGKTQAKLIVANIMTQMVSCDESSRPILTRSNLVLSVGLTWVQRAMADTRSFAKIFH